MAPFQALDGPTELVGKVVLTEASSLIRVDVYCNEKLSECTGKSVRLADAPPGALHLAQLVTRRSSGGIRLRPRPRGL